MCSVKVIMTEHPSGETSESVMLGCVSATYASGSLKLKVEYIG